MSQSIYDKIINHYIARYVLEKKLTKYLDIRIQHNFYILKLDIKKYFYSTDHTILLNLLKDKLSNIEYKFIETMIDSTISDYVNKEIEKLKINEIKKNPNRRKEIEDLPIIIKVRD